MRVNLLGQKCLGPSPDLHHIDALMETAALYLSPDALSSPASASTAIGGSGGGSGGELIEMAPPRVHYAPFGPGIQQSRNGDLSILAFDAIDDHLPLGKTDVIFTLKNAGIAAADSFKVDILFSEDPLIGNSDDIIVESVNIVEINAEDTLTRTVSVQLPLPLLSDRAQANIPGNQGVDYTATDIGFLGIRVDTQNRVIETDEENNTSSVKGIGIDDVSYFPWDIDGSEQVDVTDEIFVADQVGEAVNSRNAKADFDGDGLITQTDKDAVSDRVGYRPNAIVTTPAIQVTSETPALDKALPVVEGVIAEATSVSTLKAGFENTPTEDYVDISGALLPVNDLPSDQTNGEPNSATDGQFSLDAAQLNAIYGDTIPDGQHTLTIAATNATGTQQGTVQQTFTLDTTKPTYLPAVVSEPTATFSKIKVDFSEAVDSDAARQASYRLNTGGSSSEAIAITSASRLSDSQIELTLAERLSEETTYEFSVAGVSDLAGNAVAEAPFILEIPGNTSTGDGLPDESVLTRSGSYSADVGLSASLALPGNQGVDVVMTSEGAIAAVNTDTGSALYWIDPETGAIAQTISLPGTIRDIAFDSGGTLAIASDNKLLQLSATTGALISEIELSGITRVAISKTGVVGAIANRTVHLYDSNNAPIFSKFLNYREVTDLEIRSGQDGNNSVYVTSFRNSSFIDLQGKRNPVQIAKLEAFDFSGEQQWSLFGNASETIKQNVADTRLYRVTLGQDGYLYIGGESAGTATIFRWSGQPMTEGEQFGSDRPFLTQIDANSRLYNSGSAHISYYGRVNPLTGQLVTSQLSFPRTPNTKSNTMRIGDIAANTQGTLYFGGTAYSTIPNRENLTFNGQSVGSYGGQDAAWMSVAPDFRARNFWTTLAQDGSQGTVQGVDAGYGYSAALSNMTGGTPPITTGTADSNVFISFTAE